MSRWMGKIFAKQASVPAGFFAATDGSAGGDGSFGDPWDIQTALNGGPADEVQPGDTIWLRGGTYTGLFESTLNGNVGSGVDDPGGKIHVKQYTGETAIIANTAVNVSDGLLISGTYTWFWDFAVTSAGTDRVSSQSGQAYPNDINIPGHAISTGHLGGGTGCKFLYMKIKNGWHNLAMWAEAVNCEAYGCIIYYAGAQMADGEEGHGIYTQNHQPSTRRIRETIVFGCCDYQIHAYGESSYVENHTIDGCFAFRDGILFNTPGYGNISTLGGGTGTPAGNVVSNCAFYGSQNGGGEKFDHGDDDLQFTDNYSGYNGTNGGSLDLTNQSGTPVVTGNSVYAGQILPGTYETDWPTNNWYRWSQDFGGPDAKPTGTWSVVRPATAYRTGRGHVAIFNWDHSNSINVNCSSFLTNGDGYAVYHAMDPGGSSVASGTFGGTNISFPMQNLVCETPVGISTPTIESPAEFAAFVVVKT